MKSKCCPHCGSTEGARAVVTERYVKHVDMFGESYGMSDNKIISVVRDFIA
jgi:hypothetical protein